MNRNLFLIVLLSCLLALTTIDAKSCTSTLTKTSSKTVTATDTDPSCIPGFGLPSCDVNEREKVKCRHRVATVTCTPTTTICGTIAP